MGKTIDKTNLGYLGIDFQYQLAKLFVEDHGFFGEVRGIVKQNAFTDALLRTFVGTIIDYYEKESVVPTYETIGIILRQKSRSTTESEEYEALIRKIRNETTLEGCNVVREYALKFFKQQNLIRVANNILDIAGKGDIDKYEECQKMLDDAALQGQEDEFGFSPFDIEDKALSQTYKVPIPTGVSKLDEAMNGGLEKKKFGLIIGSAGFGKSTFSTAIASYASTYKCALNDYQGFKVLQIYFEDDDVDIARKHFSRITQVEARNLTKAENITESIREQLYNYPDRETMQKNLRLKSFRANTKSASDIEIFIKRLINTGFKPDLVIIDYFECLLPEKGGYSTDSEWARQAKTMRKIDQIAKDLDIAIWVPTQGNKDSFTSTDVVTMNQAGGSISKVQVAQVVLSIKRSLEDQDNNRATLAILKNRSGKSGSVFHNIKFDNGTSTISCDEVIEFDSELAYEEEASKIKERKRIELTRKLAELQNKESSAT